MRITFRMPSDQDWDPQFWDRIGIGPEWDRFANDLAKLGCEMDDDDDVVLTFPMRQEIKVRQQVRAARDGSYGQDVKQYWLAAKEKKKKRRTTGGSDMNIASLTQTSTRIDGKSAKRRRKAK